MAPLSISYTGPGDYESLTHTLTGFPTEVPPAITALQRAWIVARGQHEENVRKPSAVHTLHLAWEFFSPFRSGQILPSIQVPDQIPPPPGRLPSFSPHMHSTPTKVNVSLL